MRLDVYVHFEDHNASRLLGEVLKQLDLMQDALSIVSNMENKIMATLDEVLADVADESTKIDSLSTLVAGIKAQLDAILAGGGVDPATQAKVDQLFAGIEANKAKVQAAIDANTPASPQP